MSCRHGESPSTNPASANDDAHAPASCQRRIREMLNSELSCNALPFNVSNADNTLKWHVSVSPTLFSKYDRIRVSIQQVQLPLVRFDAGDSGPRRPGLRYRFVPRPKMINKIL